MLDNGLKVRLGDNVHELEKLSAKVEKLMSYCKQMKSKLLVEDLQLKSELLCLDVSSHNGANKEETRTNLDNVGTNIRLDLSVPSSFFYNNVEEEEEEEEDDE